MKLCHFEPIEAAAKNPGRSTAEAYAGSRAGIVQDGLIREISGEIWGDRKPTGREWPVANVRFLPPSWPTKIICMARNYLDHATEMGGTPPKQPVIFSKPPSSIIAPEEPIVLPRISERVDYEGELAFIIGRRCSHPRPTDDIRPYIAGYTCLNDVTARDLQRLDGQYTRGKGFDTFCPFGPVVETERPSPDATIETFVNGARKQSARVSDMVFSIDVVFRWIAEAMTLEPGDLITTGTPAGVGPLVAGDVVEVRVGGIGALRNPVVAPRD
ncbi:MAG: fumarylacetoacetate hydrolase family protein [Candidatus Acidiferrales bacterium]|jgi:2-keto-4-pentenoate hydratase/2-oxohepta-3-ene-1,7-dioic acid hydratase in catechol pathway